MRGLILAAALAATTAMIASTQGARADDEWCGYAVKDKAIIECGYSTVAQCETALGKGGMCFIDPDYALDTRRAPPLAPVKAVLRKS